MVDLVMYSGGIGSWYSAFLLKRKGSADLRLLFTDTLIEDEDLYRFLIETAGRFFDVEVGDLLLRCYTIPDVKEEKKRTAYLESLAFDTNYRIPQLAWISDGRTPWEVFKEVRYLGNSRIAPCSHKLKQEAARAYVETFYKPDEVTLYLGIHYSERERLHGNSKKKGAAKNWLPYRASSVLDDPSCVGTMGMLEELERQGIKVPRLYSLGFSHNNCGGFCVRAGQGHFANLLETMPDRFAYHAQKEKELAKYLRKPVAMLRQQRQGTVYPLTLLELAKDIDGCDRFDIGGCGCFVDSEE